MPAPIAKGLIIAVTIVVAAGIAVYESPQVREFVNKSRRKIAIALHSLGEEIQPNTRRTSSDGENGNEGPDSEEMRRLRRVEIAEQNRQLYEQREALLAEHARRMKKSPEGGHTSFDDFLRQDADEKGTYTIRNTSATNHDGDAEGLRRRQDGIHRGLERGGAFANPFADPVSEEKASQVLLDTTLMGASHDSLLNEKPKQTSRETTATLPAEGSKVNEVEKQTGAEPAATTNPLVDLSTSATAETPTQPFQPSAYWSVVHEWAENTSPSFYNPADAEQHPLLPPPDYLEVAPHTAPSIISTPSLAGSGEEITSRDASIDGRDADVMSDAGGASTVGSWTEVGSEVSDGDHGDHV